MLNIVVFVFCIIGVIVWVLGLLIIMLFFFRLLNSCQVWLFMLFCSLISKFSDVLESVGLGVVILFLNVGWVRFCYFFGFGVLFLLF